MMVAYWWTICFHIAMMKHFYPSGHSERWLWMSGAIVAAIRCRSLHWFIPSHSPLKPSLFAIESALSCASAWEFSVLSFEQPAMSSAPNVPNSTMTHTIKTMRNNCISHCQWSQNYLLLFSQEKVFCSNLETDIHKIHLPVAFIDCDTSSRGNIVAWRNEGTVLYSSPNGSKRNLFD